MESSLRLRTTVSASALLFALLLSLPAFGLYGAGNQQTLLVSKSASGTPGDDYSQRSRVSANGRFVVFESHANNLVPFGPTDNQQVYRYDLVSGETTLVSQGLDGGYGDEQSGQPAISADGTRIVFNSFAPNLVPGDANGTGDVFVRDMVSGETTIVSVTSSGAVANNNSEWPAISADGRHVAFASSATDIVAGFGGSILAVFVRDLESATTTPVSKAWNGGAPNNSCNVPEISADGRYVAFESQAHNLLESGTQAGRSAVYRRDMVSGETTIVSQTATGVHANDDSFEAAISADGNIVAFHSQATNLTTDVTYEYGIPDVFVRDIGAGTTTLLSRPVSGDHQDVPSGDAAISGNGRFVAFMSHSSNLVTGDENNAPDVFVRDLLTGSINRVSVSSSGIPGDGYSNYPSLSHDGRTCTFESLASSFTSHTPTPWLDVFVAIAPKPTTATIATKSQTLSAYDARFTLAGTLAADGGPLSGKRVVLQTAPSATATFTSTSITATTTANGTFSLKHLPRNRTYYRVRFAGDTHHTSSASTQTVYALPQAKLGTPKMPAAMYVNKGKAVSGTIYPSHSSGYVKIQRYRYSSTKKKYLAYKDPISASFKGTSYSKSIKLPYKGRWKVRVWHADTGHAKSWSPMPTKYITVK